MGLSAVPFDPQHQPYLLLWTELCLPQKRCQSLNLSTSECDFVWE